MEDARKKLRVGVFAGGPSSEHAISLKSAAHVMQHLDPLRYEATLVEVDTQGRWATPDIDIAFIAMHGTFAEDGTIQRLLDAQGIPHTGSSAQASAIGMNKMHAREVVAQHGLTNPRYFSITAAADSATLDARIRAEVGYPCIIKPNASGSSVGMSLIDDETSLASALATAFAECDTLLIEQYIQGREFSCGVLGNTGQTALEALPVVEIITTARFFDYDAKYDSQKTREVCPAELSPETAARIQEAARTAHEALGCDGLTRSDFIVSTDDVLYFLETNTIPGMTEASICPKEAAALGWTFGDLLNKQIGLALLRYRNH